MINVNANKCYTERDTKRDSRNITNGFTMKELPEDIEQCKVNEACVERTQCLHGYIINEHSIPNQSPHIDSRIITTSKMCKLEVNEKFFMCCQRKPENNIKQELHFSSTVRKEPFQLLIKPIYQNNHHLQNTVAPPTSSLISGVGPLPNQQELDRKYRTNTFNPYSLSEPPIILLNKDRTQIASGKPSTNEHVTLPNYEEGFFTTTPSITAETLLAAASFDSKRLTHTKQELKNVELTKPQITPSINDSKQASSIVPVKGDLTFVTNGNKSGIFPAEISGSDKNSTFFTNDTLSSDEPIEYSSTTTTTTPKPYIHNGIPVPLSEEFKNHPPVGCIHKGTEFHIEPLSKLPSTNYEVPVFEFGDGVEPEVGNTTTTTEGTVETTISSEPLNSAIFNRTHYSEVCPIGMNCLNESLCPPTNSKEDSQIDARFSFRKGSLRSRLQCPLKNSDVVGICCIVNERENSSQSQSIQLKSSYSDNCGIKRPKISSTVDDRTATFFGEFPWQIMILNSSDEFICSGALLDKRTIITTANCVHQYAKMFETPISGIKVRVGEWNRQNNLESEPTEDIPVTAITVHPDFVNTAMQNDIALLFIEKNVTYDYNVARVCLPPINENFDGKRCISTGWAASRKTSSRRSSYLRQIELLVLSQHTCQGRLQYNPTLGKRFTITKSNICARGENNDICESDNGDPLVCESGTGEYQLVGLSSWTGNCGQLVPGVYVNIPHHMTWITTHMNQSLDNIISSQKQIFP